LVDDGGALVDTFEYDSFGELPGGAGGAALPSESAGDFRFQGMWLDAGTGMYYARARVYEAESGRFTSRDPVEGQAFRPESWHPYVFANGNAWVWRDPEGLWSFAEINVGQVIDRVMNTISQASQQFVREQLTDEARDLVTQAVVDAVLSWAFASAGFPFDWKSAGKTFESFVTGNVCGLLTDSEYRDWLWLQVPIKRRTGTPAGSGLGCAARFEIPSNPAGTHRPDFLLSELRPNHRDVVNGSEKTLLVGDFKLTGANIRWDGQALAMARHARRHEKIPAVLYLSLTPAGDAVRRRMWRHAQAYGLFVKFVYVP
jgi:RHS repeat-associated protein